MGLGGGGGLGVGGGVLLLFELDTSMWDEMCLDCVCGWDYNGRCMMDDA